MKPSRCCNKLALMERSGTLGVLHPICKMGTLKVLRLSGLLLAVGIGLSILARPWPVILTGFALVGLGTANVVPTLFILAATYFIFISRHYKGKVSVRRDNQGYY
jgi:hypothetical protein